MEGMAHEADRAPRPDTTVDASMAAELLAHPRWSEPDWKIGQMFIMGWSETTVTPQIRRLIEEYHVGSIIFTAKNFKSAQQTARLIQELQTIAHQAGHPEPLLIAVDQENGGVNSLFDENYICQFPSAMGQAAAGGPELAREIAKATATQIKAVGVNMILGPVLDVLSNARYQPLGVRAVGDDPVEVYEYAKAAMDGYREAGIATCGKHFPSYGNLDFRGSSLDIPVISQTLEELKLNQLVPFRKAIESGKLDAMFVGGCGMSGLSAPHACLSEQVVDGLLRRELGFDGVVVSECLEMKPLRAEVGVATGTVRAVHAGCDLLLLCRGHDVQLEALAGLRQAVANEQLTADRIDRSLARVLRLKRAVTSWDVALRSPPGGGVALLADLHSAHMNLSKLAYERSITLVRDVEKLVPLSRSLRQDEELALLTPLVNPLPSSSAKKSIAGHGGRLSRWHGEDVFRDLGRSLARSRKAKLLHTSYTENGVRDVHESLIKRAACIIILTADANRNLYQDGFVRNVASIVSRLRDRGKKKSLIVVAVSSPYHFALDPTIGTYLCTFDFTDTAMRALVKVLVGGAPAVGSLTGTLRPRKKTAAESCRPDWLVEPYDSARDGDALSDLVQAVARAAHPSPHHAHLRATTADSFELLLPTDAAAAAAASDADGHLHNNNNPHQVTPLETHHLVIRNSSTSELYGFCAAYFHPPSGTGMLGALLVAPPRQGRAVGHALHSAALRALRRRPGFARLQLGTVFPSVFPGIPIPLAAGDVVRAGGGVGTAASSPVSTPTSPGTFGHHALLLQHDGPPARDLRAWFAATGCWDGCLPSSPLPPSSPSSLLFSPSPSSSQSRRLASLHGRHLGSIWDASGAVRARIRAELGFERLMLVPGPAQREHVLAHVAAHAGPDVVELYRAAMCGDTSCAIFLARSRPCVNNGAGEVGGSSGGSGGGCTELVGSIIICGPGNYLERWVPQLQSAFANESPALPHLEGEQMQKMGGILAPVVAATMAAQEQRALFLQGLALMGIKKCQERGAARCLLAWVEADACGPLLELGFEVAQLFEMMFHEEETTR